MLHPNLREDPCPAAAAEVCENVIPRTLFFKLFQPTPCGTNVLKVRPDIHDGMDATPALYAFLHEDLISRTLPYEQALKAYRLNEIKAGRGILEDPHTMKLLGCDFLPLPSQSNSHRPGVRGSLTVSTALLQKTLSRMNEQEPLISLKAAPASNPASMNQYTPINTLLSIPLLSSSTSLA